jgi:hypothetical protein
MARLLLEFSRAGLSTLAFSIALCGVASAQVPVIDGNRLDIEKDTHGTVSKNQEDTRKLKGGSGGVTDSVAPGQGSGAPDACTDAGMGGSATKTAELPKNRQQIADMVERIAREEGVDPNQAMAIAMQESRFNQNALSPVGARGVMQLMPETAAELGVNPYNIEQNIRGGVRYLRGLLDTFGGRFDLAAAGYNAGPNRASLRAGRIPNIAETIDYVQKTAAYFDKFRQHFGNRDPAPDTVSDASNGFGGCGEQLKKAFDRDTEMQVKRGQVINDLVKKALQLNGLQQQAMLEGLRGMSESIRGNDAGEREADWANGVMRPIEVQCPSSVLNLGSTQCFAVPATLTSDRVREWLGQLQEQARAQRGVATFDVTQDATGGLIAIVETRPQG